MLRIALRVSFKHNLINLSRRETPRVDLPNFFGSCGKGSCAGRERRPLILILASALQSQSALSFLAGACLVALVRTLHELWLRWRVAREQSLWRRKVDFSVIQACIMTSEHLKTLGRIEKRTLFVKPIREFFCNEYVLHRVLEAAEQAASTQEPVLVAQLDPEDKWHVLNTCTNYLSSCFAPYHLFFNEARRVESYYKSAWYCFTLTCAQTSAAGRWFITPNKPVMNDDIGMLRVRIVLMNEQELREIASGAIEPPEFGFLNGRHESRWKVCMRIADLFERQLRQLNASTDPTDWGGSLGGTATRKGGLSSVASASQLQIATAETSPEDNAILRLHIPFPTTFCHDSTKEKGRPKQLEECVAKDVVLFE